MKSKILILLILSMVFLGCTQTETAYNQEELDNAVLIASESLQDTYDSKLIEAKNDSDSFLKKYSSSLIQIHLAREHVDLSGVLYLQAREYYFEEYPVWEYGYDYGLEFGLIYFELSKNESMNSKTLLNQAKKNLLEIKKDSPNEFFKKDVDLRIQQIEGLNLLGDDLINLTDNAIELVNDTNGLDEISAKMDIWDELIDKYNSKLQLVKNNQDSLDLHWGVDWYKN